MLSIAAIKPSSAEYYLDLAREDYYFAGGEPLGVWAGGGAERLGLKGHVRRAELASLLAGFAPRSRRPLVQNAGEHRRQSGWDLTFSCPKSVSVLWSQVDAAERTLIQTLHAEAVRETLGFLERRTWSRVGRGGVGRVKSQLVVACFEHGTSRAHDPQLHTHCLVVNVGVDELGVTRTILSRPLYQDKLVAGAYYRCELARLLHERLGLVVHRPERRRGELAPWFELSCVPAQLIEHFSQRRQAIEEQLAAWGTTTATAAAHAALATRDAKQTVPRHELLREWRQVGRARGFEPPALQTQPARALVPQLAQRLILEAADQITIGESAFNERRLLQRTLEGAQTALLPARSVETTVRQALAEPTGKFVPLGTVRGETAWTTREVLREEQTLLQAIGDLQARPSQPLASNRVRDILQHHQAAAPLALEQRQAIETLCEGRGVATLSGWAGTGKTTVLGFYRECEEAAGRRVVGASLAGVAARNLEAEAGIPSHTVRSLLRQLETQALLDQRTTLVIDEASMVGVADLARLAKASRDAGANLLLVGDERQLPAIERGGAFDQILATVGGPRLEEMRRQHDPGDRLAAREIAVGRPHPGLVWHASKGGLVAAHNQRQAIQTLVTDWATSGGAQAPRDHRILVATRADAARVNELCQQRRADLGEVNLANAVQGQESRFGCGDRVRFAQPFRPGNVAKGVGGAVVACTQTRYGSAITVAVDGAAAPIVVPLRAPHERKEEFVALDYGSTTHAAQGLTTPHAYVLLGGGVTSRELGYVQLSRHRHKVTLYATEAQLGPTLSQLARRTRPVETLAAPSRPREPEPLLRDLTHSARKTLAYNLQRDRAPISPQL